MHKPVPVLLDVQLRLVRLLLEQVDELVLVQLEHERRDGVLPLVRVVLDDLEDLVECPRRYPGVFVVADHRVRLTAARLPVRPDAHVVTVHG